MNQVYKVINGKAVWCGRNRSRSKADHLAKMSAVPVARVDKRKLFWYGKAAIAIAHGS